MMVMLMDNDLFAIEMLKILSVRYVGVRDVGVWNVWGVSVKSLSYSRY